MKQIKILILALISMHQAMSQTSQDLYFTRLGDKPHFYSKDYTLSKAGFYMYRNCIYRLVLKNKYRFTIKVVDIRNDSIIYVLREDPNPAYERKLSTDTFSLHPSQIKGIRFDGQLPIKDEYIMRVGHRKSRYVFQETDQPRHFEPEKTKSYGWDSSWSATYEQVAFMQTRVVAMQKERTGPVVYHKYVPDPVSEYHRPMAVRKGIWFTPTRTGEITGLNLGLQTGNFHKNSLTIRGVNLNADVLSIYVGMHFLFALGKGNTVINLPDSVDSDEEVDTRIHGLSLSMGGLAGDNVIRGVSINGGVCMALRANGLVITGSQNLVGEFKGVNISLLRNWSFRGNGLQIGLLNVCKHLKGVQIGLWNVNSKRRLPFINWDFKGS